MKFTRRSNSRAPQLALTSMLDVIFLLLCFFVTVSVYSQWESEIDISLPSASNVEDPERLPGEVIVNLRKDGTVSLEGASKSLEELEERLVRISKHFPGQPVIIRADKETPYEELMKVIDTCRAADVWNFSLATEHGADAGEGAQ